ncbi:ATP-binding protein [Rhizobium paknamense]|uniref:histidine kinase n=1 Tax=Rhizobium paknamense TaxID=1206817 RepID=A0ABU0IBY4_9HYPH|nr:ATP-binding protein [Rhizobium paknamense]MDQ0455747.1 two-component system sensor histidine kinase QseC [Rhizobium paknamense]
MTLSQRLFLRILPTLMITIAIIGLFAYRSATREINNIYDAELINDANTLWVLLQQPLERRHDRPTVQVPDLDFNMENQLALNEDADDYADAHSFRVWRGTELAFVSSNAFSKDVARFKVGFSNYRDSKDIWRVYSLPIPNTDIVIEVAENVSLRDNLVANILLNLFLPLIILIPAIAGLIWIVIHNGLSHIRELVRQIRSRSPDDLTPISRDNLPRDLIPLAASLNQFLDKLQLSLTLERRFSDLAAHQLRTPQAGIKLLLQMLEKADSEEERRGLIADLVASNERAMHLIEQMLNLARVSHQALRLEEINLSNLAASAIADLGTLLTSRHFQVELEAEDEEAMIQSDSMLLRMLIDNLLDNAVKYSPDGGRLLLSVVQAGANWRLSICDEGPGIAPEHRQAVFQQFHRLDMDQQGTGLGLAIVAGIADRLSIAIELGTSPWGKGLRVDLTIPLRATGGVEH